ncbi:F-box only protein 22 [Spea bombifrons]|uniref:F-box only protein 22 n=1 Tax=Spea bombifrons TaxID=233779 RepID=UPI00234A428F|nr:F-box only protein 22 [Spea bombifrons]
MAGSGSGLLDQVPDSNELRVQSSLDIQGHLVLSNLAEVVERVLSFLPVKSLLRAACVCRLWRDCARRKLKARQRITWMSCSQFFDQALPVAHSLVKVVKDHLEELYVLPETLFYVTDYHTINWHSGLKRARKKTGLDVSSALEAYLPDECQILGLATPGVVVTPMGSLTSCPLEVEHGEAGFALVFPKMNGVKIEKFQFSKDPKSRMFDESQLHEAGLKNNPDLRVVLIFAYNTWRQGDTRFVQQVVNTLNEKSIIIAGGQVEHLATYGPQMKSPGASYIGVVGLTFSGPQIQAASVVLDDDVENKKSADSVIQRLKAANIPEDNSVGFMFACVARGVQYYGENNVEANLFRKHFPNVPLFGFFGNGEIGCDRVVSGKFTLRECNCEKDDLLHGYTTVITIIHFGK